MVVHENWTTMGVPGRRILVGREGRRDGRPCFEDDSVIKVTKKR